MNTKKSSFVLVTILLFCCCSHAEQYLNNCLYGDSLDKVKVIRFIHQPNDEYTRYGYLELLDVTQDKKNTILSKIQHYQNDTCVQYDDYYKQYTLNIKVLRGQSFNIYNKSINVTNELYYDNNSTRRYSGAIVDGRGYFYYYNLYTAELKESDADLIQESQHDFYPPVRWHNLKTSYSYGVSYPSANSKNIILKRDIRYAIKTHPQVILNSNMLDWVKISEIKNKNASYEITKNYIFKTYTKKLTLWEKIKSIFLTTT